VLRRILILISVASLIAFVFTVIMNFRSQGHRDVLAWSSPHRTAGSTTSALGCFAISTGGVVTVGFENVDWMSAGTISSSVTFPQSGSASGFDYETWRMPSPNWEGFWATQYVDWQPQYRNHQYLVRVPWPWFYVPTLVIAAASYLLWRRVKVKEYRRIHGLCPVCGYDLCATPAQCPECGTAVAGKAGA